MGYTTTVSYQHPSSPPLHLNAPFWSSLFLRVPGQMMAMFVVIKQSVFDQELSDTRFVQVAALAVVVELKDKNYQDSPPCQVFSPGAGPAPTTVYQRFLGTALHHQHPVKWAEENQLSSLTQPHSSRSTYTLLIAHLGLSFLINHWIKYINKMTPFCSHYDQSDGDGSWIYNYLAPGFYSSPKRSP